MRSEKSHLRNSVRWVSRGVYRQNSDTLRHRVTVHKQKIRDASTRILYVSGHIDYCARNQFTKFKIWPLYKMQNDNAAARKMKENFFIHLFKPKLNRHT